MSDYLKEMVEGFQHKDPRFIDLGNHLRKEETHILTEIPSGIFKLKNLKWIYLINTEISEIDLNALKVFAPQAEIALEMNWE